MALFRMPESPAQFPVKHQLITESCKPGSWTPTFLPSTTTQVGLGCTEHRAPIFRTNVLKS